MNQNSRLLRCKFYYIHDLDLLFMEPSAAVNKLYASVVVPIAEFLFVYISITLCI